MNGRNSKHGVGRQKLKEKWNLTTWPVYTFCWSDCTCRNILSLPKQMPTPEGLTCLKKRHREKVVFCSYLVWTNAALKQQALVQDARLSRVVTLNFVPVCTRVIRFATANVQILFFQKSTKLSANLQISANFSKHMPKIMYFEQFSFWNKSTKIWFFFPQVTSCDLAFTMAIVLPLALWILKLPRTPGGTQLSQTQLHDGYTRGSIEIWDLWDPQ